MIELNVKAVEYSTDENKYITLYAKPNSPVLGKRFGKRFKDFKQKIEALDAPSINEFLQQGKMEIDGEQLDSKDILVFREAREGSNALSDRYVSIDLDCKLNVELIREGLAREVINRIQKSRKEAGFNVSDRIRIRIKASNELLIAVRQHRSHIMNETLALEIEETEIHDLPLAFDIDEYKLGMSIERVGDD